MTLARDARRLAARPRIGLPGLRAAPRCSCSSPRRSRRSATPRSLVLGAALAALTVCFLWLERLPLRPGLGVAVLGGVALRASRCRSAPRPTARSRGSTTARSPRGSGRRRPGALRLGPLLRADRLAARGRELLRINADRPHYWKALTLDDFDGERWVVRSAPDPSARNPRRIWRGLDSSKRAVGLTARASPCAGCAATPSPVRARPSRSTPARGARWRPSRPGPGRPTTSSAGDSYRVRFQAPRPNGLELSAATSGARGQPADPLEVPLPLLRPRAARTGRAIAPRDGRQARAAPVQRPRAAARENERRDTTEPGGPALRNSPYWQTWQLAQRLKRGTRTPYDYVRRVDAHLGPRLPLRRAPRTRGARPGAARALPDRRQRRLLPALLGRDGAAAADGRGPGARGTGFSPGGFRRRQESGSCATATRTRGSRRGSTASAG